MEAKKRWRRWLCHWLVLLGVIYAAYLSVLFCVQRKMIYPGVANRVDPAPPVRAGLEVWKLDTPAGPVEAFLLCSLDTAKQGRGPALVFAHGNGEVIDEWVEAFDRFRQLGYSVLLVEYPGYGRSAGAPTSDSIGRVMLAGYDRLAADPRVDAGRIVGIGESLGGGVICALSRQRPLQALILQSTFPSLKMFASRYLAPGFLIRDLYDNEAAIRAFPGPVLVMHGRQDDMIPVAKAKELAAASPRAILKLYDWGHCCWYAGPRVQQDMEEFLGRQTRN